MAKDDVFGFWCIFWSIASLITNWVGCVSKLGFETDKMQRKKSYIEVIDTAKALKKAISDRVPLGCHDAHSRCRKYSEKLERVIYEVETR